mmetsp:Transcript_107697/g.347631  ORF Transcript_107697/g.347631 Transcript_107697/m.347631 type:complete len:769 (+) Transcript_107697:62-2368(+)
MSSPSAGAGRAQGDKSTKSKGERTTSFKQLQEGFSNLMTGFSRLQSDSGKRKKSLSHWKQYSTVSWPTDAKADYDEHTRKVMHEESGLSKAMYNLTSWCIPALIGVLTATSGSLIEKAVEWLGDMRFGYCSTKLFFVNHEECGDGWVSWSSNSPRDQQTPAEYFTGFGYYVAISTTMATVSALLTWAFAPMARGSGIPEIKTILGGFVMPQVLDANTLVIKIIGLSFSVAAGLACGKEGPLVHIACCWANLISKFTRRYSQNESKQRELLSTAAAAGVSVAFGAPLGGVLFSLEEVSTMFPNRTMIRSFFAAVIAALTLQQWNPTGTGRLTMFEATYNTPPKPAEYIVFLALGVLGGCLGALFVHWNIMVSNARAQGTPFRRRCHIVLEVLAIALITALTSFPLVYTRVLSSKAIRALFHSCTDMNVDKHEYMLDLCVPPAEGATDPTWQPALGTELVGVLLLSSALRFVQMIFTFGTGCPAGLFVPSLYAGAALGRVVGIFVRLLNDQYLHYDYQVNPGIYAMIGAAAVLGGVCRVTISLVVIMFELTSGLQLIIPFMLAVLTAKWVGDWFTIGIYDYCILIRKYPYLHEPDEVTFHTVAKQLMDEAIECVHANPGTLGQLLGFLKARKYGGYPLTRSPADSTVIGYIHTKQAIQHLERILSESQLLGEDMPVAFSRFLAAPPKGAMDLSELVDEGVLRCVPEMPAAQLHSIFRSLGVKLLLIVSFEGKLVGMLTKKSFISHMDELHHHEPADTGLKEHLLPRLAEA